MCNATKIYNKIQIWFVPFFPVKSPRAHLFLLDGLRSLGQAFDFESLGRLEEGRKLVLGNVDLSGVHELENSGQMLKINSETV